MFLSLSYAECLTPTGKKNHSIFLIAYSVFSLKQTYELFTVGCYYQQTSERKVEIIFCDATSVKSFELCLRIESDKLVSDSLKNIPIDK